MILEIILYLIGLLAASGIIILITLICLYGWIEISKVWRRIRFKRDWYYDRFGRRD